MCAIDAISNSASQKGQGHCIAVIHLAQYGCCEQESRDAHLLVPSDFSVKRLRHIRHGLLALELLLSHSCRWLLLLLLRRALAAATCLLLSSIKLRRISHTNACPPLLMPCSEGLSLALL